MKSVMPQKSTKKLIAKSAEGYPLLGFCIYWSFSETKIPHQQFLDLLKKCKISESIAPETKKKAAVAKAVDALIADEKKNKFRRKVAEDKESTVWVVVHQTLRADQLDVGFTTETKVFYNKKTKEVRIHGAAEVAARLKDLIADYEQSYTTDQIRASILQYVYGDCQGVMVRENGGIYFAPVSKNEEFERLEKLFDRLSPVVNCDVNTIPVVDTKTAAQAMWKALVGEARQDLSSMREDIEKMPKGLTDRQTDIRLERYKDLRTKIEMYESLLNGTAKDLMTELEKIETIFRDKISG